MKGLILFSAVLIIFACGDHSEGTTSEQDADLLDEVTLNVADSIGIEMGDSNYVFGSVMDVEILPGGNIMVLDGSYCNVRVFSPEGVHLHTFAGEGGGPGELMNPFDLLAWGNGEISVIDVYAGGIHRYTEQGEWLGHELQMTNSSFLNPIALNDSEFVSFKSRFFVEGDAVYATAFVGLFPVAIEPSITYWEETVPWDPANMGNLANELLFNCFYAADRETGMVYVSPFNGDGYEILCFNGDGTEAGIISAQYTPVPKTAEEIQTEKDFVEFFLRNSESDNPNMNFDCDPWPNHLAVTGLYMGLDGNLWAKRGGTEVLTFDIWNDCYELEGTASIPDLPVAGQNWSLVFSEDIAVAWSENPESFQKLYILRQQ